MILISDKKMLIPSQERFLGYVGDNLTYSKEFIITEYTNNDNYIYRLFLTFKSGESNFFTLYSESIATGVKLIWDIQKEHIFESGIISAQIKVYENDGEIWHSSIGLFQALESLETSSNFKTPTEFEQLEEKINEALIEIENASLKAPIIGENENWFIYNSQTSMYEDSGLPSRGEKGESVTLEEGGVQSEHIAPKAVTEEKLSDDVVEKLDIGASNTLKNATKESFSNEFQQEYLYLPCKSVDYPDTLPEIADVIDPTFGGGEVGIYTDWYKNAFMLNFKGKQIFVEGFYSGSAPGAHDPKIQIRQQIQGSHNPELYPIVFSEWKTLETTDTTGNLIDLETTDKTNIVSAINEINKKEYTGTQSEWDLLTEEQKQEYDIVYIYE